MLKKYQTPMIIGGIIVLLLIAVILNLKEDLVAESMPLFQEEKRVDETYIYVDIKGEVKKPGVYKVLNHTRLFQLVTLAGGFTDLANQDAVNLSQTLYDETIIKVPSINAEKPNEEEVTGLISINQADKDTLMALPNIGESTALKIIAYRKEHGPFIKIEDLMEVSGIGEATFEAIRPFITL